MAVYFVYTDKLLGAWSQKHVSTGCWAFSRDPVLALGTEKLSPGVYFTNKKPDGFATNNFNRQETRKKLESHEQRVF